MELRGAGVELIIPLGTVRECQRLRPGQALLLTGLAQKQGSEDKDDVAVKVKKVNNTLSMYFAGNSMGAIFNKKLSDSWRCNITASHILEPESSESSPYPTRRSSRKELPSPRDNLHLTEPAITQTSHSAHERRKRSKPISVKEPKRRKPSDAVASGIVPDISVSGLAPAVKDEGVGEPPDMIPEWLDEDDAEQDMAIGDMEEADIKTELVEPSALPSDADDDNEAWDVSSSEEGSIDGMRNDNTTEESVEQSQIQLPTPKQSAQFTPQKPSSSIERKWTKMGKSAMSKKGKKAEHLLTIEDIRLIDFTQMKLIEKVEDCSYYCLYCGMGFQSENLKFDHLNENCEVIKQAQAEGKAPVLRYAMPTRSRTPAKNIARGNPADETYNLVCRFCDKGFRSTGPRKTHEERYCDVVTAQEELTCLCWQEFQDAAQLVAHKEVCAVTETDRRYPCEFCSLEFVSAIERSQHTLAQHGDLHIVCRLCVIDFNSKSRLKLHMLNKHKDMESPEAAYNDGLSNEVCPICSSPFSTKGRLTYHMFRYHPDAVDPSDLILKYGRNCFPCLFCSQTFKNGTSRYVHQMNRCRKNPDVVRLQHCKHCTSCYKTAEQLDAHYKQVHPEGKCFICDVCGAKILSRTAMYFHKKRHSSEPAKYQCPHCVRGYHSRFQLDKHITIHSEERNCVCQHCGKTYKSKLQVDRHVKKVHENRYPYRCMKCGHGMDKQKYLDAHICGRVRRAQDNSSKPQAKQEEDDLSTTSDMTEQYSDTRATPGLPLELTVETSPPASPEERRSIPLILDGKPRPPEVYLSALDYTLNAGSSKVDSYESHYDSHDGAVIGGGATFDGEFQVEDRSEDTVHDAVSYMQPYM